MAVKRIWLIAILIFSVVLMQAFARDYEKCFTAAVYEQINIRGVEPIETITKSLEIYQHVIEKAAENGAQIVVFPEHGIFIPSDNRDEVEPFLEIIPDATTNPCDNEQKFESRPILYTLSCAAKRNKIYVISNMGEIVPCRQTNDPNCPSDGRYQHNTAVVFNDAGFLIAKYRKYHLYGEKCYNAPDKLNPVTFETSFGKFGIFVCFDSLFREPGISFVEDHNVTSIALMTWWFNEMPFLFAHVFQQSWAISTNVNFLAANANEIKLRSCGSGIYNGANGAVIYTHNVKNRTGNLLIARLSVNASDTTADCGDFTKNIPIRLEDFGVYLEDFEDHGKYKVDPLDFTQLNYTKLVASEGNIELCHTDICCSLNYTTSKDALTNARDYYFSAGSRNRNEPLANWCEELCLLSAYDTENNDYAFDSAAVFDHIHLSAKFTTNYVFPSLTSNNLDLVPTSEWTYSKNGNFAEIETKSPLPLISAGLFGRCYDRD